jgi:hypothetical protein
MQADIPPAAVEAAAQSLYTEKGVGIREAAIDAVQAALPHIEADLEARWRERLLSEEFARSVYWALPIHESNGLTIWQLKRAIADAALFGRAGLAAIERRSQ